MDLHAVADPGWRGGGATDVYGVPPLYFDRLGLCLFVVVFSFCIRMLQHVKIRLKQHERASKNPRATGDPIKGPGPGRIRNFALGMCAACT